MSQFFEYLVLVWAGICGEFQAGGQGTSLWNDEMMTSETSPLLYSQMTPLFAGTKIFKIFTKIAAFKLLIPGLFHML